MNWFMRFAFIGSSALASPLSFFSRTVDLTVPAMGGYCSEAGSYHCTPGYNSSNSSAIGVCNPANILVEHAPCGSGNVCKKRFPSDPSVYCVPPAIDFCENYEEMNQSGVFHTNADCIA